MKISSKLVLTAAVLLLLALAGYDLMLKSEYLSGSYNIPYRNFSSLGFRDFDEVDVYSSTAANVLFTQGPFSVKMDKYAADYIQIRQEGRRLHIDAAFRENYQYNPNTYVIVISCPRLSLLALNATYQANNMTVTDTLVRNDWDMRRVMINGFKEDALVIEQDYGSTLVMDSNSIRSVQAILGKSRGSGSKLIIQSGNHFEDGRFDINQKSKLQLGNAKILNFHYQLSDSAKLEFSGDAQHFFKPSNTVQP